MFYWSLKNIVIVVKFSIFHNWPMITTELIFPISHFSFKYFVHFHTFPTFFRISNLLHRSFRVTKSIFLTRGLSKEQIHKSLGLRGHSEMSKSTRFIVVSWFFQTLSHDFQNFQRCRVQAIRRLHHLSLCFVEDHVFHVLHGHDRFHDFIHEWFWATVDFQFSARKIFRCFDRYFLQIFSGTADKINVWKRLCWNLQVLYCREFTCLRDSWLRALKSRREGPRGQISWPCRLWWFYRLGTCQGRWVRIWVLVIFGYHHLLGEDPTLLLEDRGQFWGHWRRFGIDMLMPSIEQKYVIFIKML